MVILAKFPLLKKPQTRRLDNLHIGAIRHKILVLPVPMLSPRRNPAMLGHLRTFLFLAAMIAIPSFASAGGKTVAPAVPGFARFYADEKADAAKGGRLLFNELLCARCHSPSGAADSEKDLKPAPILDGVGGGVKRSYLKQFLADPQTVKPGAKMPNLFVGMDADENKAKVEALVHYLASTGSPAPARPDRKGINVGQDLYSKVGCVACHGTRDAKGEQDKTFATSVPLGAISKAKYNLLPGLESIPGKPAANATAWPNAGHLECEGSERGRQLFAARRDARIDGQQHEVQLLRVVGGKPSLISRRSSPSRAARRPTLNYPSHAG